MNPRAAGFRVSGLGSGYVAGGMLRACGFGNPFTGSSSRISSVASERWETRDTLSRELCSTKELL